MWREGRHTLSYCRVMCITPDESERTKQFAMFLNNGVTMKKFMLAAAIGAVLVSISACGVSSDEHAKVVTERDMLRTKVSEADTSLAKAKRELEKTKYELATEIKVKQAHAVREEQAKQRLKQAERDLASALRELSAFKRKK